MKTMSHSKWRRLPKYSAAYVAEAKARAGQGFRDAATKRRGHPSDRFPLQPLGDLWTPAVPQRWRGATVTPVELRPRRPVAAAFLAEHGRPMTRAEWKQYRREMQLHRPKRKAA